VRFFGCQCSSRSPPFRGRILRERSNHELIRLS
jgi:hypothetical protein